MAQLGGIVGAVGDMLRGGGKGQNSDDPSAPFKDSAPPWDQLRQQLEKAQTGEEKAFRGNVAAGRGPANHLANIRLFDSPEGTEPRVTLYRDKAAWCPYCQKVWFQLELKRIPYKIEKVNMRCYGDKPDWFMRMQPSGGIPVAKIDGRVITESNDIMQVLESSFPEHNPLLPEPSDPQAPRVQPLLRLERQLFSSWFRWLISPSRSGDSQQREYEKLLSETDAQLGEAASIAEANGKKGGFFLGEKPSIVDCMFAPFLERMAASLPYYKGLLIRNNPKWRHVNAWFDAMEAREEYKGIQSDYYTHCHDLPPQIGNCFSHDEAKQYAAQIDGSDGSWRLPLKTGIEPWSMEDAAARRQAAERVIHNHAALVPFALRAVGSRGFPPVGARLSDPNAVPDMAFETQVDAALRHTVQAMLNGDDTCPQLSSGLPSHTVKESLGYLRDRISVPRDMNFAAARQLRAHLNLIIDSV